MQTNLQYTAIKILDILQLRYLLVHLPLVRRAVVATFTVSMLKFQSHLKYEKRAINLKPMKIL